MYCQLELETTKGKLFTGPFVFSLEEGIEKLSRMGWLTKTKPGLKRGKLRLVETPYFPKMARWHPKFDDESGERHTMRIAQVEWAWQRAWEEEEDD